ncbi:MAG: chromosomal replication initiator protein DnaA [Trueperella sp.]|nr:chromosomal replication initiator protein DnaA [Trueperella sp.]
MTEGSPARDAWNAATELLRAEGKLSDSQTAFVRLCTPLALVDDVFMIGVSSDFVKNWISEHVAELMTDQVSQIIGRKLTLMISIDPSLSEQQSPPPAQSWNPPAPSSASDESPALHSVSAPDAETISPTLEKVDSPSLSFTAANSSEKNHFKSRLNPRYTFDSFVVGESNRFAHATSFAVAENPGSTYNPLFLYSDSGMGKTHLLHAIGNYVMRLNPKYKVLYVSSEEFMNSFINALSNNQRMTFKDQFRSVDMLLIDDIQFLSRRGKDSTLTEFFHTFNALTMSSKQIVISSDVAPKFLTGFEERLISRFSAGITASIDIPDLETRIAILDRKAKAGSIQAPREVLEYIATQMTTNVREMEGALQRASAWASLNHQPLSIETAEIALKDVLSDPESIEITAGLIMAQTASYFDVTIEDLRSPNRTRTITQPRHMAMYLCKELTDLSLPKIADIFNRRDHSTVIHAIKKIDKKMTEDQSLFSQLTELTARIKRVAKEQSTQLS